MAEAVWAAGPRYRGMTTSPNERIQALDVLLPYAICGLVFLLSFSYASPLVNLVAGVVLLGAGTIFVGGAGLIPGLFLIGSALASYRVPEELPGRPGLLATVVFVAAGLAIGLEGSARWGAAIVLGRGILAAQAVLSPLWLRRFRYGPMEWLWRCVTWWRWMPIRAPEVRATT